jgi:hypothetical protein
MRWVARLGAANAALVSLYFAPAWGIEAIRSLRSPYLGLEHKGHATAAAYYRAVLDLGPDGVAFASQLLSGIKLVVAVAFLAYLIEFVRALAVGREPDRATLDLVVVLAASAIMLWAWPELRSGDGDLIRLHASEFLMLCGAMIVIVMEEDAAEGQPRQDHLRTPGQMHPLQAPHPIAAPATAGNVVAR